MRPWLAVDPPMPEDVVPFGGADWNQVEVVRAVDGDTVRLNRRRVTVELASTDDLGPLVFQCWQVRVAQDDAVDLPGGLSGRLVNLNTPERGQAGYEQATGDLEAFVAYAGQSLRCVTYDTGGGFDRLLVDLYCAVDGARHTATEWMLRLGWAPYVEGR